MADWGKVLEVAPAWVQAIGSVAAIYWAARIATGQVKEEEKRRATDRQEILDFASRLADLFHARVIQEVAIIRAADNAPLAAYRYDPAFAARIAASLRLIDVKLMPDAARLMILREIEDCIDVAPRILQGPQEKMAQGMARSYISFTQIDDFALRIEGLARALHGGGPGDDA